MTFIEEHLLEQVKLVSDRYNELSQLTGENYNVFRILGLEAKEVSTHSAMISELLDPDGSHNRHSAFLELFLKELKIDGFKVKTAHVEIEKHIGYIDTDYNSGGYVDIIIANDFGQGIIIENKVYAGDQRNQLKRYVEYGSKRFPSFFKLYYLTLNGRAPSLYSAGEGSVASTKIERLSYSNEIINWLEQCKIEAASFPILRESITQYIYLIKYLTGQTTNDSMKEELVSLISKSGNMKAAFEIQSSIEGVKLKLLEKLKADLQAEADKQFVQTKFDSNFGKDKYDTYLGFTYHRKPTMVVYFGFNNMQWDFFLGISEVPILAETLEKISHTNLVNRIGDPFADKDYYFLHYFLSGYLANWNLPEVWERIINGSLAKELFERIQIIFAELDTVIV